jgi:hypothetical protein
VFCGKFVGKTYFIGLENKTKYIFVREWIYVCEIEKSHVFIAGLIFPQISIQI